MLFNEEDFIATKPSITVARGDLFLLNQHRIYCGDCTDPNEVNKLLGKDKPILTVTDPPYGINYDPRDIKAAADYNGKDYGLSRRKDRYGQEIIMKEKKGNCKRRGKSILGDDSTDCLQALLHAGTPLIYAWYSIPNYVHLYNLMIENGYEFKYMIVWNKKHATFGRSYYKNKYEVLFVFVKSGNGLHWRGDHRQTTVWDMQTPRTSGFMAGRGKSAITAGEDVVCEHSNQKPLDAMRKPIINHTDAGEYVYDPFLGSGTTLIAAESINRNCLAMEIDPHYTAMAIQRWNNLMVKNNKPVSITKITAVDEEC